MTLPRPLLLFTTGLAFAVILLGAYVRLSDAGLGCPDWPGCYGQISPWHADTRIADAHSADPLGPVSHAKAWKEMLHRYLAGSLGLLILAIAILAWRRLPPARRVLPGVLLALVVFQALLGMWTITQQLKPMIVAAHLLGGMATLALLAWLLLRERAPAFPVGAPLLLARGLLLLVLLQIALGGWVSANYAALACSDFPTCQGAWWPQADFAAGFSLQHSLGGLGAEALTAIHLLHRLGAVLVLAGALLLAARLVRVPQGIGAGACLLAIAICQFLLGMANVLLGLPLPVAVAHNAGAAALLLCLVWVNVRFAGRSP
ncbi:MAG: COX15/CtaA family protein [Pseudomonadota bacterium]|nr:COX15/CtaA family protein [Pseudomonadota bacterium]